MFPLRVWEESSDMQEIELLVDPDQVDLLGDHKLDEK